MSLDWCCKFMSLDWLTTPIPLLSTSPKISERYIFKFTKQKLRKINLYIG